MVQKDKIHKKEKKGGIFELISVLIQALLLAAFIRTLFFQPFSIPSGSMRPTLLVGDYLFVSKYAYGYSHFSIPFSPPLFSGRIWASQPKRGDVVVFRLPSNPKIDYIKRVIGLPGDRIQIRQSVLYINDKAVSRHFMGEIDNSDITEVNYPVEVYRETLPNGVHYDTLDLAFIPKVDDTKVFEVPQGHYFMMGDNRDNSDDSRLDVGYVPEENLIGRASVIFFSISNGSSAWQIWRWPFDVRWKRLFSFINKVHDLPLIKQGNNDETSHD
ncbi:signal peptidase I [Bartonella krasnovii]|uniref:Signal peptidase I n=1 Tax=Bartonella krasnovii TaxID=2267275 RepID=A0ABY3VW00_9HYPH|nr:signal peptidase I [Bartonella krasnovii]UNF29564.1 signal peptidase I [Bartonella krasnovii]UNF35922.1 signal peptidase I [Bartonella krasnovii]UNF37542.1 signal peptidase I [Bartonella krasnovii]UNF39326.1 signal peptidase I [Bartonella krasnovii]UNF40961.1 signal peptidase I [Bartonella krasnovii]